jgi:uncharacterized membrane protein YozB (DUF420 family)
MTASSAVTKSRTERTPNFTFKVFGSAAILIVALVFVINFVLPLYLHYNETAYNDDAPNHWALRGWLLMHITGGTVALLAGPWQFWTGFRRRYARLHRWMGRVFLCGVAVGSVGAYRLAIGTTFGWAFGLSLLGMATAWFTSAAMAFYAIVKGRVQVHKDWMVRAYVVTFAFVTFRVLNDYYPGDRLQPSGDRAVTVGWASWVLPLLFTELILQLRRMRSSVSSA